MWQKLKQCKNFHEIYEVLTPLWFERVFTVFLLLYLLLPFLAIIGTFYSYYFKNLIFDFYYREIFEKLSIALLLFFLFYLLCIPKDLSKWKQTIQKEPWLALFGAMMLWGLCSTLLSANPKQQFLGDFYRKDGYFSYLVYLVLGLISYLLSNEKVKRFLLKMISFVGLSLSLILFAQAFQLFGLQKIFIHHLSAVFNNSNHLGYLLTMTCLISYGHYLLDKKKANLYLISFTLQYYAIIVNNTFGCYLAVTLAAIIFAIIMLFYQKAIAKRTLVPLGLALLLSIFSFFNLLPSATGKSILYQNFASLWSDISSIASHSPTMDHAGTSRIGIWRHCLELIGKKPLFGYGPEGSSPYREFIGNDRPHNEYIQHALFLGIPALIFYLSGLLTLCIHRLKNLKKLPVSSLIAAVAVIGYLISAFFGNTMFYTTYYFWILLGFVSFSFLKDH